MRGYFDLLDPAVMQDWASLAFSPSSYLAFMERISQPRKYHNWLQFMAGARWPELVQPVAAPGTYASWITLPVHPHTYTQLQGPMRMLSPAQPFILWNTALESAGQAMLRFLSPIHRDP
jgi:hypothetical protein